MKFLEAIKVMEDGYKIKADFWTPENGYLQIVDGEVIDENGEKFVFGYSNENYIIHEESNIPELLDSNLYASPKSKQLVTTINEIIEYLKKMENEG